MFWLVISSLFLIQQGVFGKDRSAANDCPSAYPVTEHCEDECKTAIDAYACDYREENGKCKKHCKNELEGLKSQLEKCAEREKKPITEEQIAYQIAKLRKFYTTTGLDADTTYGKKSNGNLDRIGDLVSTPFRRILDRYESQAHAYPDWRSRYTFPLPGHDYAMKQLATDILEKACKGFQGSKDIITLRMDDRIFNDIMLSFLHTETLIALEKEKEYEKLKNPKNGKTPDYEKGWKNLMKLKNKDELLVDDCLTLEKAKQREKDVDEALLEVYKNHFAIYQSFVTCQALPPSAPGPGASDMQLQFQSSFGNEPQVISHESQFSHSSFGLPPESGPPESGAPQRLDANPPPGGMPSWMQRLMDRG